MDRQRDDQRRYVQYTYEAKGNEITKTDIATGDNWTYGYNNANEMVLPFLGAKYPVSQCFGRQHGRYFNVLHL